jgi:hypothetical protein
MKSFPRPRVFWSREDKPPTLHEEVFEHWLDLVGKCQIPLSARNSKGLQSRQDGVCSPNGRQYSIRGVDPGPFADRDLHPLLLKQSPPGGSAFRIIRYRQSAIFIFRIFLYSGLSFRLSSSHGTTSFAIELFGGERLSATEQIRLFLLLAAFVIIAALAYFGSQRVSTAPKQPPILRGVSK